MVRYMQIYGVLSFLIFFVQFLNKLFVNTKFLLLKEGAQFISTTAMAEQFSAQAEVLLIHAGPSDFIS